MTKRTVRDWVLMAQRYELAHWLSFPRVQPGVVRIISPEGFIDDVQADQLDASIEGNNEYHHCFHDQDEWQEFIAALSLEDTVRGLPVSDKIN